MGNIILGAGEEGLRLLPAVVSEACHKSLTLFLFSDWYAVSASTSVQVSFLVYFIVKAVFGGCRPFLHQLRSLGRSNVWV